MPGVTRLVLALAALLLPATLLDAAVPKGGAAPGGGSLVGQLLIAAPDLPDPSFHHAVVLVVRHSGDGGAFGIIINRPVGKVPLADLMDEIGESGTGIAGSLRVFAGGPLEPGTGFILHSAEYRRPETLPIDERVSMTSSAGILRDIGHDKGPAKTLVAFGYAGWGPGQLEAEIADHDWFTALEDPGLVFDEDRAAVWDVALKHRSHAL